ncbi:hypothetical protein EV127DRAFT_410043 [Xylaria flabelliformis]|nr:hypothetical protein EV127DRAFT_410043 [Xylaria flabelliformis]
MYSYNTIASSSPSPGSLYISEAETSRQGSGSPTIQQATVLAIHINMHDATYMSSKSAHMDERISRASPLSESRQSSVTPSTSTYGSQDMARSYTSVAPYSPYSVPAYESSLPTPVSVAGSPSMSERSEKMLSTYNQQGGVPQQLTPPSSSHPWPYTPSMANASSASMAVPSSAAEVEMLDVHSLESSHSPEQQTTVLDSTPHFHWSTYGVSSHDPTEDLPPPLPSQALYSSVPPSLLIRSPAYGLPSNTHVPLAPALPQGSMPPHPADTRHLMAHDYHQFDNLSNICLEYGQAYPARKSKARVNRNSRQSKRGRDMAQNSTKSGGVGYDDVHKNSMAADASSNLTGDAFPKHLTLDDKAPEDSRYLVNMRCQLSDDKGKGMWEQIQQAYKERYGRKTKENLQMQLIRSVQSYAIWPEEEDKALKDATEEYERRRYQEIRKIMKEKGGRRVWDWNEGNIAKRLVQMGVDEIDDRDPIKKTRRKRKSTVRQKSGGEPWAGCVNIQYNSEPRELTAEENELLLEEFCKPEPDSPQPEAAQHLIPSNTDSDRDSSENPSARVAKQACDQMLARQGEHLYNGHNQYMA